MATWKRAVGLLQMSGWARERSGAAISWARTENLQIQARWPV